MSANSNLIVAASLLGLCRPAAWVEEKYGEIIIMNYIVGDYPSFPGPTLLPEGYNFELVHRHLVTKGQFQKGEFDKNIDNPDAELYSHLTVKIEYKKRFFTKDY